jgi:hypothetical protein
MEFEQKGMNRTKKFRCRKKRKHNNGKGLKKETMHFENEVLIIDIDIRNIDINFKIYSKKKKNGEYKNTDISL